MVAISAPLTLEPRSFRETTSGSFLKVGTSELATGGATSRIQQGLARKEDPLLEKGCGGKIRPKNNNWRNNNNKRTTKRSCAHSAMES